MVHSGACWVWGGACDCIILLIHFTVAQAMMREAAVAREAADSLSAEAAEELKLFTAEQSLPSAHKALREPVHSPVAKQSEASSDEDIQCVFVL